MRLRDAVRGPRKALRGPLDALETYPCAVVEVGPTFDRVRRLARIQAALRGAIGFQGGRAIHGWHVKCSNSDGVVSMTRSEAGGSTGLRAYAGGTASSDLPQRVKRGTLLVAGCLHN